MPKQRVLDGVREVLCGQKAQPNSAQHGAHHRLTRRCVSAQPALDGLEDNDLAARGEMVAGNEFEQAGSRKLQECFTCTDFGEMPSYS
jgi:hypothetical protein